MESLSVISFLVLVSLWGAFIVYSYLWRETHRGTAAAKKQFREHLAALPALLVIGVILIVFDAETRDTLLNVIMTALLLLAASLPWLSLFRATRVQLDAGSILLDLGTPNRVSIGRIGLAIVAGIFAFTLAADPPQGIVRSAGYVYVIWGFAFLSYVGTELAAVRQRAIISHLGIYTGYVNIPWDQIKGFTWTDDKRGNYHLVIETHKRLSWLRSTELNVPATYKETVENLLSRYVSAVMLQPKQP